MFGAHGEVGLLYSFARPVRHWQLRVRRAGMYEWRRRVVHGVVSVVHSEGRCLCAGARPRRDQWQGHVDADSISERLRWLASSESGGMVK